MPGPYFRNPRRRCGCYAARWLHNLTCGRRDPRNLEGTRYRQGAYTLDPNGWVDDDTYEEDAR